MTRGAKAAAEEVTVTVDGIKYTYDSSGKTASVAQNNSVSGNVIIPKTITVEGKDYTVTSIGDRAFDLGWGLTDITIPDTVTSIGERAFNSCQSLTSITIPDSVTNIGNNAFDGCKNITSITLPKDLTSIGSGAFSNCTSLENITISEGVTSIGSGAFSNCTSIEGITIPEGVTSIGSGAFSNCRNLESITIPEGVTSIENSTFYYCSSLTSITLQGNVTSIGDEAFFYCTSLKSITPQTNVTSIGNKAFYGCQKLTDITLPNCLTSIGEEAFVVCKGLTDITVPEGVTSIGKRTFYGCDGLTRIILSNKITSIGENAFSDCDGLTDITLPKDLTSIGDGAFWGCDGLTDITLPEGLTSIGNGVFWGCDGLTGITIPNSVTGIGEEAFSGCSGLKSIMLPSGLTSIGANAFFECTGLTSIMLPNGLTTIWNKAFANCSNLSTVWVSEENIDKFGNKTVFPNLTNLVVYNCDQTNLPTTITYDGADKAGNILNSQCVTVKLLSGEGEPAYQLKFSSDWGETWSEECINAGTYQIKLVGGTIAAGYVGEVTDSRWTFEINPYPVTSEDFSVDIGNKSFTYDGTDYSSEIKVEYKQKILVKDRDYTIEFKDKYSNPVNSFKNAGEYQAIITGLGNFTGTIIKDLTIQPASGLTVSLTGSTFDYDGNVKAIANSPTTNVTTGTTIKYSFEENGTYTEDLSSLTQTKAGDYTVYVKATNPNYSEATTTATLSIKKRNLTITADSASKEYDGAALVKNSVTAEGFVDGDKIESVTVTGSRSAAGKSDNVPSAAKIVNANGDDVTANYEITYKNGTLTVFEASAPVLTDDQKPVPKVDTKESGDSQELIPAPASVPGYTTEYSTDGGKTWSTEIPVATKSGTYAIQVRYKGDENHADFDGETLTVTILGQYASKTGDLEYPGEGTLVATIKKLYNDADCYENFTGVVEVDGKQAKRGSDFTDAPGSTIITFSEDYMKGLTAGDHLIRVVFKDGEVTIPLKVLKLIVTPTPTEAVTPTPTGELTPAPTGETTPSSAGETTPAPTEEVTPTITPAVDATPVTGDAANPLLWTALILMSMAGVAVMIERKRHGTKI